jgi:hypothetical protein
MRCDLFIPVLMTDCSDEYRGVVHNSGVMNHKSQGNGGISTDHVTSLLADNHIRYNTFAHAVYSLFKKAYNLTDGDIQEWELPDADALGRCQVGVKNGRWLLHCCIPQIPSLACTI